MTVFPIEQPGNLTLCAFADRWGWRHRPAHHPGVIFKSKKRSPRTSSAWHSIDL